MAQPRRLSQRASLAGSLAATISYGDTRLTIAYDRATGVATVNGVDVSLDPGDNVIFVDRVDDSSRISVSGTTSQAVVSFLECQPDATDGRLQSSYVCVNLTRGVK
jgi:hypothetical protein